MLIKVLSRVTDETITMKDGRSMRLRGQFAELYTFDHEETGSMSFKLSLEETAPPYAPGFYSLGRECFQMDRNNLQFAYRLKPVAASDALVSAFGLSRGKGAAS